MDEALDLALKRLADAASRRGAPDLEATVERSRKHIEDLAAAATALEASIPEQLGIALRDGVRTEVLPVARQLAEIRGLSNQAIRRLERLETEIAADRHARVDDLELLVALVSSAWRSLDARLVQLEEHQLEAITRVIAAIEDLPVLVSDEKPSGQYAAA